MIKQPYFSQQSDVSPLGPSPRSDYTQLLEAILNATQRLIEHRTLDGGIRDAIAQLGKALSVDRVYVVLRPKLPAHLRPHQNTDFFAWVSRNCPLNLGDPRWHYLDLTPLSPSPLVRDLRQGHMLQLQADQLPPPPQKLADSPLPTVLIAPIHLNHQLWGVLGIETFDQDQCWSEAEERALLQFTRSLGGVVKHHHVENQLSHNAFHDPLTTLPNRALFLNRLSQSLQRIARNPKAQFAVLFLDLDRFKPINDSLGHHVGDRILIEVAKRLSSELRTGDTLARLGGDEFVILLDNIHDHNDAAAAAARFRAQLVQPFDWEQTELSLDVSVGITLSSTGYQSAEELLQQADLAMYQAKISGKGCYRFFKAQMQSEVVQRPVLETQMGKALSQQEFEAYYQPIIQFKTGQLKGFEALARWNHPQLGLICPDQFIPMAEENGLIKQLGQIILTLACQHLQQWNSEFAQTSPDGSLTTGPDITISVNLSAKQLYQRQIVHEIKSIVDNAGVDPTQIILELTESSFIRSDAEILGRIHKLQEFGIRLFLDDFGAGYSSLRYLNTLPLNGLKIDRLFTEKLHNNRQTQAIVRSIVVVAQALNMEMVAEGIETLQQAQDLYSLGCTYGQGFLYSPPVSYDVAKGFLASPESFLLEVA